jgi:pimeloyl-CoA synthetase
MALASDAEYWCLIVRESCVCDVMENLLCYVALRKFKYFGFNRNWNAGG